MKKTSFLISILTLLVALSANAQVAINNTGNTPNPNAMLDIQSTEKGLLIPRVALQSTTLPAPLSSHVAGMLVYDTVTISDITPGFYYNDGTKWLKISDLKSGWGLTGNSGTASGTNFLGTTDKQSLEFRVSNIRAGFIEKGFSYSLGQKANTSFGLDALVNFVTTPSSNNGALNAAFGYYSLNANSTGSHNSAFGSRTLWTNTTGSYNVAVGNQALQNNRTGNGNTGVGQNCFQNLESGSYNVAIGSGANSIATSGSFNVAIGYATELPDTNGSYQLNIGNTIFGIEMQGALSNPAGKIGINTISPGNSLEVNSKLANASGLRFSNLASTSTGSAATTTSAQCLTVNASGDVIMNNGLSYVNTQAGTTYTISVADNQSVVYITSATAVTITVPNTLPAGFSCAVIQGGAGIITFTGTGLQNTFTQFKTPNQYASVTIQTPVVGTNVLSGQTSW